MLLFSPQILLTVHWCEVNYNMKRLKIDTNFSFIIIWLSGSRSCYLCVTEGDFLFPLCMFSSFVVLPPYCLDAVRLSGIDFGKQKAYHGTVELRVLTRITN